MEEPSVLDYLKSKVNPRRKGGSISFREALGLDESNTILEQTLPEETHRPEPSESIKRIEKPWPWILMSSFSAALVAQWMLEPPRQWLSAALVFYGVAAVLVILSLIRKEVSLQQGDDSITDQPFTAGIRSAMLYTCIPLSLLAFLAFGGNKFNLINLVLWLSAIICGVLAFWTPTKKPNTQPINRLKAWIFGITNGINVKITPYVLLIILACLVVVFFRFYRLNIVPGEMFSDHAEKLLDVSDVLNGQFPVFFTRNTGREAFQMYLTALMATVFGTGLTFTSLKLGTVLAGLFTLPYIYLLGKELGNKWVGLLALLLAGMAYWPNVISRVALRFSLYPLFAAPTLYYLIRGLKRSNRNDFILAGLALGLGLHGYSPMRVVPLVLVFAVAIYLLHNRQREKIITAIWGLLILAFISLIVFLPLLRYMVDQPEMFGYRLLSRLGTSERVYPGPVVQIFLSNLWKSIIMPFWNNGSIWVHSIPNRPALGFVSAASFFLGIILVFVRYIQKRDWADLFLLFSIPALMLPSILSLAFPGENPSLNRSGAAYIPIFIVSAYALERLISGIFHSGATIQRKSAAILIGLSLIVLSALQNYALVFDKYHNQFLGSAWNTSEIGKVIRSFADSVGDESQAFVVPYAHWVDTRLVGINAGYPRKDFALWPDSFESTTMIRGPKLFIIKPEDQNAIARLSSLYPKGNFEIYPSKIPGKEFLMFFVPPDSP